MHPTPTQAEREQAWRDLARISLAGAQLEPKHHAELFPYGRQALERQK